jgi:hypothetical protein
MEKKMNKSKDEILQELKSERSKTVTFLKGKVEYISTDKTHKNHANMILSLAEKYKKINEIIYHLEHEFNDGNNFNPETYLVHYEYCIAPNKTDEELLSIYKEIMEFEHSEEWQDYYYKKGMITHSELCERGVPSELYERSVLQ